jgi:hypothetical protein
MSVTPSIPFTPFPLSKPNAEKKQQVRLMRKNKIPGDANFHVSINHAMPFVPMLNRSPPT